jgi:hypothetical protein
MLLIMDVIVRAITSAKVGAVASSSSFQFSFRNAFTCSPETGDYIVIARDVSVTLFCRQTGLQQLYSTAMSIINE